MTKDVIIEPKASEKSVKKSVGMRSSGIAYQHLRRLYNESRPELLAGVREASVEATYRVPEAIRGRNNRKLESESQDLVQAKAKNLLVLGRV